jgi:heme/copper-type cytochrome/quinol oxidase subunit 3
MKTQLSGPISLLGWAALQLTIATLTSLGFAKLQQWFLADVLATIAFCFVVAIVNRRLHPLDMDSEFAVGYGRLAIGSSLALLIIACAVPAATYFASKDGHRAAISFVFCALAFGVTFFGMLMYENAFQSALRHSVELPQSPER